MKLNLFRVLCVLPIAMSVFLVGCESKTALKAVAEKESKKGTEKAEEPASVEAAELSAKLASDLEPPVKLEAGGRPIDMARLSDAGHAGPWIADVDCDGDRDLLVGDFPGYFWFFENTYSDGEPKYAEGVKLLAGGVDAKVPVY